MMNSHPIRRPRPAEEGYMLVAVMFLLAILVISLAVAAPRIKDQIQRDREVETMQRGKQYIRAIRLYYRKFHAYPPNMDALAKTQEIRFLRRRYIDPITGKDDWKPVQFGQNKAPTALGFFGQPIGGSTIAGIGPGGGNGLNGAQGINGQPGSSSFGSNGAGFGSNSSGFGSNNSGFGSNNSGSSFFNSNNSSNATPGSTDSSGNGTGSTDPSAAGGTGAGPGTGIGSGTGTGLGGQTFGGAGFIGVSPDSPKQSILVYKKKTHYNEWEFVYDPITDQVNMGTFAGGAGGQPVGTRPIGGTPGFGNNGGFGSNNGFGNNNNNNGSGNNQGAPGTTQQNPQPPPPTQPNQ